MTGDQERGALSSQVGNDFRTSLVACGSKPFIGSSKITIDGWFSKARAIPNFVSFPTSRISLFVNVLFHLELIHDSVDSRYIVGFRE